MLQCYKRFFLEMSILSNEVRLLKMKNYAIHASASYFLKLHIDGSPGATARWILYHKTDIALTSFFFHEKTIIVFHYSCEKNQYMQHFSSCGIGNNVLWCNRCKIHRNVAAPKTRKKKRRCRSSLHPFSCLTCLPAAVEEAGSHFFPHFKGKLVYVGDTMKPCAQSTRVP